VKIIEFIQAARMRSPSRHDGRKAWKHQQKIKHASFFVPSCGCCQRGSFLTARPFTVCRSAAASMPHAASISATESPRGFRPNVCGPARRRFRRPPCRRPACRGAYFLPRTSRVSPQVSPRSVSFRLHSELDFVPEFSGPISYIFHAPFRGSKYSSSII
jgi:hypothetical protein